ncbi:Uncharacterised protein [Mycobacteroides abscessus subsp. abscessus]|nr:Uncharacterised protein [Mycobacteroides abscessus subsp. abscessus]
MRHEPRCTSYTLIGSRVGSLATRRSIQSSSDQTKSEWVTTEAVAGGTSVRLAIGSALSWMVPSAPWTRNLYSVPSPTSGMNNSQTPDGPIDRIGVDRPLQPSKSPITTTPCALGAHTENVVPGTSPSGVV